jgi:hypothetical protein
MYQRARVSVLVVSLVVMMPRVFGCRRRSREGYVPATAEKSLANPMSITPRNMPIAIETTSTSTVSLVVSCLDGQVTFRSSETTSPKKRTPDGALMPPRGSLAA